MEKRNNYCPFKDTEKKTVFQVIGSMNQVLGVSYNRMAAIKIRNIVQNNGYSARIQEVLERDCDDKECLAILKELSNKK